MPDLIEEPIYKAAFNEGVNAALADQSRDENPYDAGQRRHAVWLLGYQSINPPS